jgi:hypothetical protein
MRRGILATTSELQSLREKISRKPFDAIYQRLQRRCSLILESSPVTEQQWQAMWQQGVWGAALRAAKITQGRIWDLLIAHHIEPNPAFRDRAIEELKDLIRWKSWADPCHNDLPADLCTAEAAVAAVVALDWLWEDLTQADRLRVLQAVRSKAIEPYHKAVRQKAWWYTSCNNWNAVVNGGCGLAGLALGDEEPRAEEAFILARKGLNQFLASLGREGGWDEGTGYWGYAMRYLLLFAQGCSSLADDQRIFHSRGIDATGLFPVYFTPCGQAASFGDAAAVPLYGALYLLVRQFGQKDLTWWLDTYSFHHDVSTTDLAAAGLSLLFRPSDAEIVTSPNLSPLKVFHQIGWAAVADQWPRPGLYFAAKTGDLAASHSHRDMNSLQIQADGEMLLTDLGSADYTREYFSASRGEFYEVQARAHNTIIVADRDHQIDAQGRILEAQSDKTYRWVACSAAGACGENVSFVRHAVMIVDGKTSRGRMVIVLDDLTTGVPETARLSWHTTGQIELDEQKKSGRITGRQAALNFALASTARAKVAAGSHEYRPGLVDHVLSLSAGVADRAMFVSVFSRDPIRRKIQLKETSTGADLDIDGVRLRFKARKHSLVLEEVAVR